MTLSRCQGKPQGTIQPRRQTFYLQRSQRHTDWPLAREKDQSKLLRDASSPLKSARFLNSEKLSAVDWLLCLPSIHMPIPNPHCDGVRRLVLWEAISCKGETLMNGISVLIKETPECSLTLSLPREDSEKRAICDTESRLSSDTESAVFLILDLSASRTVRNKHLLFKPPRLSSFVMAAQTDENTLCVRNIRKECDWILLHPF